MESADRPDVNPDTTQLPGEYDELAPDRAEVRLLSQGATGGLCHCTLPVGVTSLPVAHRTVEELWYFVEGRGEVWRRDGAAETIVTVGPGTSIAIRPGVAFQYRTLGNEPLRFIVATMPPWPGPDEAVPVEGRWSTD